VRVRFLFVEKAMNQSAHYSGAQTSSTSASLAGIEQIKTKGPSHKTLTAAIGVGL